MNAVTTFETELAKTTLSLERQTEVKMLSDEMARNLWLHFCDHQIKHLDAIALVSLNREVQERIAVLRSVVEQMKLNGIPEVALLEVL